MIRLVLAIVCFLLSLLVLFRAPAHFLWLAAIAITDYIHIALIVAAVLVLACIPQGAYRNPALLFALGTLVVLIFPVGRNSSRAKHLRRDMNAAFGIAPDADSERPVLSYKTCFTGLEYKTFKPERIVYKQAGAHKLLIDYYQGSASADAPCVVVIHGGSWQSGDNEQLPELNSYLASKGYQVAAITYRLAPEFTCPAPVEDVRDAIAYLKQHAAAMRIDTGRFALLGRSAGGQIALMSAYRDRDPSVKGVIAYYAPSDMVWGARIPSNKLVMNAGKVLSDYLGGSVHEIPTKYSECSPYDLVDAGCMPTLLIHGRIDALVSFYHNVHLSDKLREAHVPHYFLDLPNATHGCDFNISGPDGQLSTFATGHFLEAVFKQKTH